MTTNSIFEKKISIRLLKMLLTSQCDKDELLQALNIKKTVFYNNINILKSTGFDIINKQNAFILRYFHQSVFFSPYNMSTLAYLLMLCHTYLPDYKKTAFENFCEKIIYLGEENNLKAFSEKCDFLKTTSTSKNKTVKKITRKNKKNRIILNTKKETIFELYGRLAKSYCLKEGERVIDSFDDRIVIANGKENKELLFKRLLKYDVLCKVIYPVEDAEKFKEIIKKTLENLKEFQDN